MNIEQILYQVIAVLLLFFLVSRLKLGNRASTNSTFPGPWGLPVLGHLLFLGKDPSKTFLEWKKKYGNVFEINFAGKRVLVLNDRRSIQVCFSMPEFSGKKESIPIFRWLGERAGPGLFFNDGPHVEELRTFFLKSFRHHGITNKSKIGDNYRAEIRILLDRWGSSAGQYFELQDVFTQTVLNCVWRVVASKRYEFGEAKAMISYVEKVCSADTAANKLSLVAPWLMNKLSNSVKAKLKANKDATTMIERFVEERELTYAKGQPRDIIDSFLDAVQGTTDRSSAFHKSEKSIAPAIRDVFYGAIETVSKILEFFVLYGNLYPEVIRKLQGEIHSVIGYSNCPSLSDKEKMPYAMACILELLRKATITPLASPHCATMDTELSGVPVRKGTLVLGNIYAVHHDPDIWDNPEEFRPERFLTQDGTVILEAWSKIAPFSLGKRACIGSGIVSDELFMIITSIYQKYTIVTEETLTSVKGVFGITYKPVAGIRISAQPVMAT